MPSADCRSAITEATPQAPPSRYRNPFATCWTRPGAMPYVFANGESVAGLIARLAENGWQGEVVGPHGSGKSTLLATLLPRLVASGRTVFSITLRQGERRLPRGWLRTALSSSRPLLVVDGYEQLACPHRAWLRWQCRRASAGLLITSHAPMGLPQLLELRPTRALVDQVAAHLTARVASPISPADITAGFACHGSNVRELLFELYRRHEVCTAAARTAAEAPA